MKAKAKSRKKNGVAVIIVLGMLALMMMMGVAFSISMQTERRSAGNYSHAVGTKNIVWAGLAEAMRRIDDEMSGKMYPTNKPHQLVFWVSEDPKAAKDVYINLGRGEALDYLPGYAADDVFYSLSRWRNFDDIVFGYGSNKATNVPGRFAYLIVNLSDFIDANYAGGTNRFGGTTSAELQLGNLQNDVSEMYQTRDEVSRFETVQEMNGIVSDRRSVDFFSEYMTVYSRFPPSEADPQDGSPQNWVLYTNQLYIGGELGTPDFVDKTKFKERMAKMISDDEHGSASSDRLNYLWDALTDYLDSNSVPTKLASPCTEAVPMINELAIDTRSRIRHSNGSNYVLQAQTTIETSYPFVNPSPFKFSVTGEVEVVINVRMPNKTITTNLNFDVDSGYGAGALSHTNCYLLTGKDGRFIHPFTAGTNSRFQVTMTLKGFGVVIKGGDDDGKTVDSTLDSEFEFKFDEIGPISPGHAEPLGVLPSYEAIDARFNWEKKWFRPYRDDGPDPAKNTLGKVNLLTEWYRGKRKWADKTAEIYVSNRERLYSVGELGNLICNTTLGGGVWQTFRLFDQEGSRHHLFRYFTVATNRVVRGSVNLNQQLDLNKDVKERILRTALKQMEDLYPGSGKTLDSDTADKLVSMILNRRWKSGHGTLTGEFFSVSDIIDLDWDKYFKDMSGYRKEALVSYLYGLLGTRQNLFAVVVAASPVTTGMGEYAQVTRKISALGSKKAFALVWRDPYPDKNGYHKCFVQFFKWLDD